MKTPEDKAFDDMARRQGMWGGGFPAKRQAAMDKINSEFHEEYIKYRTAFPKGYIAPQQAYVPLVSVAEPAQDNKCKLCVDGCAACDARAQPVQEPPKYAIRAYWEADRRIGVVATVERPDGGVHLLNAIIDPPKREWVGLTPEEINAVNAGFTSSSSFHAGALWAQAKLKEKNFD